PQPENLSAVAEAPAGPGGLSAGGLALLDAEQAEPHDDDHHDDHGDHEDHAHGDHGHDADHGGHDDHAHHPNPRVDPERPANAHLYFGIYYTMTGLHGAHVIIGMIVIAWLFLRGMRGDFSAKYFTPVDLGGLYWHVVDLIWIFLFPLLYLV
ncbi:MAG TPA: cytochrome oxidase subunit III, partial [Phycisphaerales bacterium]|nr:cytochrome oxidase subunit III [Phycisphaerales bacterium]